jgi:type VI secretion system secreted protein Hcp
VGTHDSLLAKAGTGDMFLSVKGAAHGVIKGESLDDSKHKGEIEVLSWSWGMQQRMSQFGGIQATGRATIRELKVIKRVDRASTGLMSALRSNETIKEAVLTLRKVGKTPLEYLKITLMDARVSALDIEGGDVSGGSMLLERVAFAFNKIKVEYVPQGGDGLAQGGVSFEDEWNPEVSPGES